MAQALFQLFADRVLAGEKGDGQGRTSVLFVGLWPGLTVRKKGLLFQKSGPSAGERPQQLAPEGGFSHAAIGGQQGDLPLGEIARHQPLGLLLGDGVQGAKPGEQVQVLRQGQEVRVGENGVDI